MRSGCRQRQIAEGVLNTREHVGEKGREGVNLLVVAVGFVKDAALARALNVAERVVAVGAAVAAGSLALSSALILA